MDADLKQPVSGALLDLHEQLRVALLAAGEGERYRLFASLLGELADNARGDGTGQDMVPAGRIEELAKKLQAVDQQRATLDDALKTTQADLARLQKQAEADDGHRAELQGVIDDQRERLDKLQKDHEALEAELVAKNAETHKLDVRCEELTLKAQRAELITQDQTKVDAMGREKRDLIARTEELQAQVEEIRRDKDVEIERLKDELRGSNKAVSEGGDALLKSLWEKLASANTPLAEGGAQPSVQSADRLVGCFIELTNFVNNFDQAMRPFLTRYTKHHPTVSVPWNAYAKGDDLITIAKRTVAAQGGRPVGVLKMRLNLLYSWTYAAMMGCDSAIESVASELQGQLMGPTGAGSDPNRKIKEYLREDGHELFVQQIRELRSAKLAEAFGRGG